MKMMKATFLCDSTEKINDVYDAAARARLHALADFDETVCTHADLTAGRRDLRGVRWLFSTWKMPVLTEEEIRTYLPNLEALFYAAGTVQAFARPFLHCGVRVFSAWAANAVPVAEYTAAQIVLANKGFFPAARFCSVGKRAAARDAFLRCPGNYDATVGIIGAGMIGKGVIRRLRDMQLAVLVFDPFLGDTEAAALGVEKVPLEVLFARCNVVSNHLANNAATKGMLDYALFAKLPQGATFINTGRGAQVVEADLCRILRERPDLTAILDVTAPEPPVADSPFYSLDNCILTPHIAGSSGNEVHRMAAYMADEFARYRAGEPTLYGVDEAMLERMA